MVDTFCLPPKARTGTRGWQLRAGKDMMMQYSPSARVSWIATDWSMLALLS